MTSRELIADTSRRLKRIETRLSDIARQVATAPRDLWVPVESFEPEPYDVTVPFTAVVRPTGDEFEATFFDANLHACGNTPEEAVANLKGVILDMFDWLVELGDDRLGPGPLQQKTVLIKHVRSR